MTATEREQHHAVALPGNVESALSAYRRAQYAYGIRSGDAQRTGALPSDGLDAAAEWRALRKAIADALAEALSPPEWQLIESAPRDGTRIFVARNMGEPWGWVYGISRWDGAKGIFGWISRGLSDPPGELGLGHPTHWRPWFSAPSLSEVGRGKGTNSADPITQAFDARNELHGVLQHLQSLIGKAALAEYLRTLSDATMRRDKPALRTEAAPPLPPSSSEGKEKGAPAPGGSDRAGHEQSPSVSAASAVTITSRTTCDHPETTAHWTYSQCRRCGAIRTGTAGWKLAGRMWFPSLEVARFYEQNGRLPQPPTPEASRTRTTDRRG